MSFSLRLLLILLAWIVCAFVCWDAAPVTHDFHGFKITPVSPPVGGSEKPFFQAEFINATQDMPFVHVASIAELNDHTITALWYGGPYEHSHENTIYFTKLINGSWAEPRTIMTPEQVESGLDHPIKCIGNPLLLSEPDGSLRLLFVTIAMGKWSGSQLNTCLSSDGSLSWSRVERLTLSPFFNLADLVRNRPIMTANGWCVPVYQEFLGKFPELLWLSDKDGKITYEKTRIAGGCSTLQPSLIPLDTKRAVVLLRDYTKAKRIFISKSEDGGLSWSKPEPTNLPNPDSGISGIRLPDGSLLVTYNNSPTGRSDLSLALSHDEGHSWKKIATLEDDDEKSFSYPYMIQSSDGMIRVAYSWDGRKIKVVSFNESWVNEQEAKQTP